MLMHVYPLCRDRKSGVITVGYVSGVCAVQHSSGGTEFTEIVWNVRRAENKPRYGDLIQRAKNDYGNPFLAYKIKNIYL